MAPEGRKISDNSAEGQAGDNLLLRNGKCADVIVLNFRCSSMTLVVTLMYIVVLGGMLRHGQHVDAELQYVVMEEQPVGSVVADLVADARLRQNLDDEDAVNFLVFDVFHGPHSELFDVDSPSGIVRVKAVVDRDLICYKRPTCFIPLEVAIVRPPKYFQVYKLSLTVTDINDHSPSFQPQVFTLHIPETASPGAAYILPAAVDRDQGPLDVQSYALTSNATERFRLDVTGTGNGAIDVELVVTGDLDHESQSVYLATVTAVDGGDPRKSGSLSVIIRVQDANDHAPVFDRSEYNATVREDFPINGVLLTVHADDADEGPNAEIVYSLAGRTADEYGQLFTVDVNSGTVSLQQRFDYETASVYRLLVAANDRGPASTPVYAKVTIIVEDVNDNPPTILVNALTEAGYAEIDESLPAQSFVAHVSVNDPDTGSSGQVRCELLRSAGVFTLEPFIRSGSAEYKLVTASTLDREERDEYQLTIVCHDDGVPSLSRSHDLVVRVGDANDNAPQFERTSYSAGVREDAEVGIPLLRVTATDHDAGDNAHIQYALCSQLINSSTTAAAAPVTVSPDTGWLSTSSVIDYETVHQVEVCVAAVDGGRPALSSTVTVTLNVVDVNDNPPRFAQSSYTFGTYENQAEDTEIGRLVAADPDSPPYNRFIFAVVSERPPIGAFAVDRRSGRLATARQLDRELTRVHYIVVAATDLARPQLSSTVNVTIFVADRNDNAPVISFPRPGNDSVEVSRHAPAGYVISRVFAYDADFANNARLSYHIVTASDQPTGGHLFDVDPDLGAVSVAGDLRRADRDRYDLVLAVTDGGFPAQSAVVTLIVNVVSKAWSEPHSEGGAYNGEEEASTVADVFSQHRLVLVILAVVTVFLTCLLLLAIVCVKCRQRRYMARKRTPMPPCDSDKRLRKNLIIENVQRTNDVNVTSETSSLRQQPSPARDVPDCVDIQRPVSPACCDAEIQALTQPRVHFERSSNPHVRTLALPFYNRLQSTQIPSNFYTLDERCHGVMRPVVYQQHTPDMLQNASLYHHDDATEQLRNHQYEMSNGLCSPAESDSTSGCSSAALSHCERDGSLRRRPDQPCPIPPSTQPSTGVGPPSCCSCTGDGEGSLRVEDRLASVSRGVGYCCTVQPLSMIDCPATPPPPPPTSSADPAFPLPTPQPGERPAVDVPGNRGDELVLTAPRLESTFERSRSPRSNPPPLPPPRRTSLKRNADQLV